MTYAPDRLQELQLYLHDETSIPFISLGIVGNTAHTSGYHLGKDRIFSATGKGSVDYSIQNSRDKEGLTNAASAMDIGYFNRLRSMSKWLVERCQQNRAGTSDIREIIYSPDGIVVLRYDRQRGIKSEPRSGEADNSHLSHTHISWYRDSQDRNKTDVFKPFFAAPVPEQPDMREFTIAPEARSGIIVVEQPGHFFLDMFTDDLDDIDVGFTRPGYGLVHLTETIDHKGSQSDLLRRAGYIFRRTSGQPGFLLATDVRFDTSNSVELDQINRIREIVNE